MSYYSVVFRVVQRQKNKIGHILRSVSILREILEGNIDGYESTGMTKTDDIGLDVRKSDQKKNNYRELKKIAQDWDQWQYWCCKPANRQTTWERFLAISNTINKQAKLSLLHVVVVQLLSALCGWLGLWYVCMLHRRSSCLLAWTMDGQIMHCGIVSSYQSAATSEIVKCFWARVTHVSSAIARYPTFIRKVIHSVKSPIQFMFKGFLRRVFG